MCPLGEIHFLLGPPTALGACGVRPVDDSAQWWWSVHTDGVQSQERWRAREGGRGCFRMVDEMPALFQKARCLAPPTKVQATQFKNYIIFQLRVKLNLYLLFFYLHFDGHLSFLRRSMLNSKEWLSNSGIPSIRHLLRDSSGAVLFFPAFPLTMPHHPAPTCEVSSMCTSKSGGSKLWSLAL